MSGDDQPEPSKRSQRSQCVRLRWRGRKIKRLEGNNSSRESSSAQIHNASRSVGNEAINPAIVLSRHRAAAMKAGRRKIAEAETRTGRRSTITGTQRMTIGLR